MKKIFIDTGAFYAKYVERDEYHKKSMQLWQKIQSQNQQCLTSNFVLAELITLFVYRFGSLSALTAAREIYGSGVIEVVSITHETEMAAMDWIENYADQKISMTDATSFALMHELSLKTAFTFDKHFHIAGFDNF